MLKVALLAESRNRLSRFYHQRFPLDLIQYVLLDYLESLFDHQPRLEWQRDMPEQVLGGFHQRDLSFTLDYDNQWWRKVDRRLVGIPLDTITDVYTSVMVTPEELIPPLCSYTFTIRNQLVILTQQAIYYCSRQGLMEKVIPCDTENLPGETSLNNWGHYLTWSGNQLKIMDGQGHQLARHHLNYPIQDVAIGPDNRLYVALQKRAGILVLNPDGTHSSRYQHRNLFYRVFRLCFEREGKLVVLTRENKIYILDPSPNPFDVGQWIILKQITCNCWNDHAYQYKNNLAISTSGQLYVTLGDKVFKY